MSLRLLTVFCSLVVVTASYGVEPVHFRNVRVFDGERVHNSLDVLIVDGKIARVAKEIPPKEIPPKDGMTQIDGSGKTLLPGLIDAHVHVNSPGDLAQAAFFGVTLELDMLGGPHFLRLYRREQAMGKANHRADMMGAGMSVTTKGGHGTQFGPAPTIASAEEAQKFVDARIAEGSDYIKIIYGGSNKPIISKEILKAAIEAAHKRKKLAVVHIDTRPQAIEAIEAGVDGLVHSCGEALFETADTELAKRKGVFIVPTTTVIQGLSSDNSTSELIEDPHFKDSLDSWSLDRLKMSYPIQSRVDYGKLSQNTLAMHRAGVPILAGSDAPNPATAHGVSLHHELELLVDAGLTPTEALTAATSRTVDCFGIKDCGRIKPGLRANLLLVEGNPLENIKDTRRIVGVWKDGHAIDRQERLDQIAKNRKEKAEQLSKNVRVISNFDKTTKSNFGAGWSPQTDGTSKSNIELTDGGAGDTPKCLKVLGNVREDASGFAGVWFAPGQKKYVPADLNPHTTLSFWIKGKPATYVLMVFDRSLPASRGEQEFETTGKWQRVSYKLSEFSGCNGKTVFGIWLGSQSPGEFEILLDEVELRK